MLEIKKEIDHNLQTCNHISLIDDGSSKNIFFFHCSSISSDFFTMEGSIYKNENGGIKNNKLTSNCKFCKPVIFFLLSWLLDRH